MYFHAKLSATNQTDLNISKHLPSKMTNHGNSSEQLDYLIGKDSEQRLRKGGYVISQKI
jgi:hypothetical protein